MYHMNLFRKPEYEDSCATITLATDQLPDDLQSKTKQSSTQAKVQFGLILQFRKTVS